MAFERSFALGWIRQGVTRVASEDPSGWVAHCPIIVKATRFQVPSHELDIGPSGVKLAKQDVGTIGRTTCGGSKSHHEAKASAKRSCLVAERDLTSLAQNERHEIAERVAISNRVPDRSQGILRSARERTTEQYERREGVAKFLFDFGCAHWSGARVLSHNESVQAIRVETEIPCKDRTRGISHHRFTSSAIRSGGSAISCSINAIGAFSKRKLRPI
jgi:ribosomal protein L34E